MPHKLNMSELCARISAPQRTAIRYIEKNLGLKFEGTTSGEAWLFINQNMNESRKKRIFGGGSSIHSKGEGYINPFDDFDHWYADISPYEF
jgi:hypothetical protein